MATSLPPVTIPRNTWIDLYDATGITVGVQIIIQNIGSSDAKLVESVSDPSDSSGFNSIPVRSFLTNAASSVGAWAFSDTGTTLQIEVS